MTQSFKVALVGFEPMRRHQSDPTLAFLSTRPSPPQFTFHDSEVTTPCLTSRTYSLLGEQGREGIGETAQFFPLRLGIEPGTSRLLAECATVAPQSHTQSMVDVVKHCPQPTSAEKVRSFLGLTEYYRKFIKNNADIAQPLSSLLKKNTTFSWGPSQIKAFETLKGKLTSSPVLIFPDYTKEFILCPDASGVGLGGILILERNGNAHPIAYASRLCTSAEKNYSITERETLAVIYWLEHFMDIILGYKIRVWTDHTAIQNLFNHKNLRV